LIRSIIAMLVAVIVIPAVVGAICILMLDKAQRPRGPAAIAKAVLRGYPYTVGLAATLALMTLFAPIIKGAHSRQALDERVRP